MSDRERLIEKHRYINVEDNYWTEHFVERYHARLARVGFNVNKIYWSGFASQGDGACITGSLYSAKRFLAWAAPPGTFPMIRRAAAERMLWSVRVSQHSGSRYSHENTLQCEIEADSWGVTLSVAYDVVDPLKLACIEVWNRDLEMELLEFEKHVLDYIKSWSRRFYRDLEKEYYHLTSDETVWETLEANDLTLELSA